jgi:hypothetical protein
MNDLKTLKLYCTQSILSESKLHGWIIGNLLNQPNNSVPPGPPRCYTDPSARWTGGVRLIRARIRCSTTRRLLVLMKNPRKKMAIAISKGNAIANQRNLAVR